MQKNAGALKPLVQHAVQAARMGEIAARQLANIAYGTAQSGKEECMDVLFRALARAAERRVGHFIVQELSNTAWAFVTATQSDALLLRALARVAERRVGHFSALGLANTAWAFATAIQSDASLLRAFRKAL